MDTEQKSVNKGVIAVVVIALLAIAATTVAIVGGNSRDNKTTTAEVTTSPSSSVAATNTPTTATTSDGGFKAGTYEATGSYRTPGGQESVTVSVTLSGTDGMIASIDTTGTGAASGGESREYQGKFLANYKELVIGKKVDEVSLSRVAGSSLTSNGFNNALDEIAQDAAA